MKIGPQFMEGILDDVLESRVRRIVNTKLKNNDKEAADINRPIYDILLDSLGMHIILYPNNDIDLLQSVLAEDVGFQRLIDKIKELRHKLNLTLNEPVGVIFPLLWPGNSLRRLFLLHNCKQTQPAKYGC